MDLSPLLSFSLINFSELFTAKTGQSRLLIIQCVNANVNIDLIACARYCVIDERKSEERVGDTHVVFLLQLPRINGGTNFAAFQGGQWVSAHIDDLHVSKGIDKVLQSAFNKPMNLFFQSLLEEIDLPSEFDPCVIIRDVVHMAVVKHIVSDEIRLRVDSFINIFLRLIPERSSVMCKSGEILFDFSFFPLKTF